MNKPDDTSSKKELLKSKYAVISDEDMAAPADEKPVAKGEIYFSNPPRTMSAAAVAPSSAKSKSRKKNSSLKTYVLGNVKTVTVFLLIVLISLIVSIVAISCVNDVLAIGRKPDVVTVKIPEKTDTDEVLDILSSQGLIKQRWFCGLFCNYTAKIKNAKTPVYLSGVYYIRSDMGVEAMLNTFKSVPKTAETATLTFPEGYTVYQIVDKIAEFKVCDKEYLYAALKEANIEYPFLSGLKKDDKRTQYYEGYLFPDTYEFYIDENPNSILRKLLDNFQKKWTPKYAQRAEELGLTTDEVIIIASIIQKEADDSTQMALISSVIHNRLNNASAYPMLSCDSTAFYITNFVKPVVGEAQAEAYLTEYNTNISDGLPPGPICNPGSEAIKAALYPKDTYYFYFQHDKSGKIYLAKSLQEHNANLIEVLRANAKIDSNGD